VPHTFQFTILLYPPPPNLFLRYDPPLHPLRNFRNHTWVHPWFSKSRRLEWTSYSPLAANVFRSNEVWVRTFSFFDPSDGWNLCNSDTVLLHTAVFPTSMVRLTSKAAFFPLEFNRFCANSIHVPKFVSPYYYVTHSRPFPLPCTTYHFPLPPCLNDHFNSLKSPNLYPLSWWNGQAPSS